MRIDKTIIKTAAKIASSTVNRAENAAVSNPILKSPVGDVLIKEAPLLRTPLTKKQILEMKPSEFKALLESRTDIPEELRVLQQFQRKTKIHSPEQLSLYDKINNILLQKNVDFEQRKLFLSEIMSCSPDNAQYSGKLLPKLIEQGYDLELLSGINIAEYNHKYIETVLKKQPMWKAKIDKLIENKIQQDIKCWEKNNRLKITPEKINEITEYNRLKSKEYENSLIQALCRHVEKDNVKYLDEWSKYVDTIPFNPRYGGIGQYPVHLLEYWTKDTSKILREFSSVKEIGNQFELLELISRRGHDYDSVKRIFSDNKIVGKSYRILEFRDAEKFRNINLDNFDTLTIPEKKEFINAYITALSIKNVAFHNCEGIETLKANIKMFEHIDTSTPENCLKTYSETLKKMIESIPQSERKYIQTKADWGKYSKAYRERNPIPALVDDLEKLPYKIEMINGKPVKVSEISNDTQLAISGHCTSPEAFLNIEALEFTDPNEILCVGTKGLGRKVHYRKGGYSIAQKPRQGNDFWMQSFTDIDSGNNATKNVANVSKQYKGKETWYSYIPDLIKKELDLSQIEYTSRMKKIKDCTTLDEIGKIDKEMENAIRNVLANNNAFEGILRPTPMGVMISSDMPSESISKHVLNYINQRDLRLIRVKDAAAKADEARRQEAVKEFSKTFKNFTI